MTITGFTRSSAEIVSQPVDVIFLGRLTAAGGDARALIKRGTTTIGRMQANLAPLGAGRVMVGSADGRAAHGRCPL